MSLFSRDAAGKSSSRMKVNPNVLAITIAVLVLGIPALYFWHSWSVANLSSQFLDEAQSLISQADEAEESGDQRQSVELLEKAVRMIWNYRDVTGDVSETAGLLAETYQRAESGNRTPGNYVPSERTLELYAEAIANTEGQPREDLRLQFVDLLLKSGESRYQIAEIWRGRDQDRYAIMRDQARGHYSRAEAETRKLLQSPRMAGEPADEFRAEIYQALPHAIFGQVRLDSWNGETGENDPQELQELGRSLAAGIQACPADETLPGWLAEIYRTPQWHRYLTTEQIEGMDQFGSGLLAKAQAADDVIDQMVQRNPENAAIHFARAAYRSKYDLPGVVDDLERAHQLEPDNSIYSFELGRVCLDQFLAAAQSTAAQSLTESTSGGPGPRALLEKARAALRMSKNERPYDSLLFLGKAEGLLGDLPAALIAFNDGLEAALDIPESPNQKLLLLEYYSALIGLLLGMEDLGEARERWSQMNELVSGLPAGETQIEESQLQQINANRQLLEGRLLAAEGNSGEAIETLAGLLNDLQNDGRPADEDLIRQTAETLGLVYFDQGNSGQAAGVLQIAVDTGRASPAIRRTLVEAHRRMGRSDLSRDALSTLAETSRDPVLWLAHTNGLLDEEKAKPLASQDWSRFESALLTTRDLMAEDDVNRWRLELMGPLSVLISRGAAKEVSAEVAGDEEQANRRLRELEQQTAQTPALGRELLLAYHDLERPDDVDRMRQKFETEVEDDRIRYLALANLQIRQGQPEQALQTLTDGLEQVEADTRGQLERARISVLLMLSRTEEAGEQLKKLASGGQPELILALANFMVLYPNLLNPAPPDPADPDRWENKLRNIEGPNGPFASYLAAQRKLKELKELKDAGEDAGEDAYLTRGRSLLQEADRLSRNTLRIRPDWKDAHTQVARIQGAWVEWLIASDNPRPDVINNKRDEALQSYQQAIDLGERNTPALVEMVRLADGDPDLQRRIVGLMDQQILTKNAELTDLQASLMVAANDLENAVGFAVAATEQRPDDLQAWIIRAQVELFNQQFDDCRNSIERARQLATDSDTPGAGLTRVFDCLVLADRIAGSRGPNPWTEQARSLIPGILATVEEEQDKTVLHARMLSVLDDPGAAELYLQAMSQQPEQEELLQESLRYFSTHQLPGIDCRAEAIEIATRLCTLDSDNQGYRVQQAQLRALRGSPKDWAAIAALLNVGDGSSPESAVDNRMHAALLLNNRNVPNSQRQTDLAKALAYLKDSDATIDRIICGQINQQWASLPALSPDQRQEKLAAAEQYFATAAPAADITAEQLATVIEFYLEQDNPGLAESHLPRLRRLLPDSPAGQIPAVSLTAELEFKRDPGQQDRLIKMVENQGKQIEQERESTRIPRNIRAVQLQNVAIILESIEAKTEAKTWWDKAVALNDQRRIDYARSLAGQEKFETALQQLIAGYEATGEANYVISVGDLLINPNCPPALLDTAEPLLQLASRKFSDHVGVLTSTGNVRLAGQNRITEAVELYEAALQLDQSNLMLLNNLATAYSEIPEKRDRGLLLIQQALDTYGNRPGLVDTKAVILMMQGEHGQAEKLLRDIVRSDSDPRYRWHLSEVKWRQYESSRDPQDLDEARSQFQRALQDGLENNVLTPGERERLTTLRQQLEN